MNIKRIIREEIGDFDWIKEIGDGSDLFINKAFEFDPIAERGDKDYEKLVEKLEELGFISEYGTPKKVVNPTVGLYSYRDNYGELKYVFTSSGQREEYESHIKDYAIHESEDGGYNLEVVDARKFINLYIK